SMRVLVDDSEDLPEHPFVHVDADTRTAVEPSREEPVNWMLPAELEWEHPDPCVLYHTPRVPKWCGLPDAEPRPLLVCDGPSVLDGKRPVRQGEWINVLWCTRSIGIRCNLPLKIQHDCTALCEPRRLSS